MCRTQRLRLHCLYDRERLDAYRINKQVNLVDENGNLTTAKDYRFFLFKPHYKMNVPEVRQGLPFE